MFDLTGIKAMGESIETFTKETHAGLVDIATQLRIGNAIAAMNLADQRETPVTDILRQAFEIARREAAKSDGGGE